MRSSGQATACTRPAKPPFGFARHRPGTASSSAAARRLGGPSTRPPSGPCRVPQTLSAALLHEGAPVRTIEHLTMFQHTVKVDNVLAEIDADELPIFEGSAIPWCDAIRGSAASGNLLRVGRSGCAGRWRSRMGGVGFRSSRARGCTSTGISRPSVSARSIGPAASHRTACRERSHPRAASAGNAGPWPGTPTATLRDGTFCGRLVALSGAPLARAGAWRDARSGGAGPSPDPRPHRRPAPGGSPGGRSRGRLPHRARAVSRAGRGTDAREYGLGAGLTPRAQVGTRRFGCSHAPATCPNARTRSASSLGPIFSRIA
jgi:hypothetical protein